MHGRFPPRRRIQSRRRLSELAKMDGAIIVSADASRIARANVHLMPSSSVPTSETGTRHRTAERVARSIDVAVISVSAAMNLITVYRQGESHVIQRVGRVMDRATQGLQSLQRFRERFDVALAALTSLEVEDTVTVRDVVAVLQPAEQLVRTAAETAGRLIELGDDGQLLRLQLDELTEGVGEVTRPRREGLLGWRRPRALSPAWTGTARGRARGSRGPGPVEVRGSARTSRDRQGHRPAAERRGSDASVEPRGYRLLNKLPRLPSDTVQSRIVDHFSSLQRIMRASVGELESVDGVGEARAKSVKEGLARLAETSILDRYNA